MGGRGIGGRGRWGQWGWNGRTNWMKRSLNLTKGPTIHVSASKAPASLSSLCSLTPSPQLLVVVACQGSCYITQTWWLFCVQQSFLLEPPAGNLRYRINLGPVSTSLVARTYFCFSSSLLNFDVLTWTIIYTTTSTNSTSLVFSVLTPRDHHATAGAH